VLEVWRAIERMEGFETVGGWIFAWCWAFVVGAFTGQTENGGRRGVGFCCC